MKRRGELKKHKSPVTSMELSMSCVPCNYSSCTCALKTNAARLLRGERVESTDWKLGAVVEVVLVYTQGRGGRRKEGKKGRQEGTSNIITSQEEKELEERND